MPIGPFWAFTAEGHKEACLAYQERWLERIVALRADDLEMDLPEELALFEERHTYFEVLHVIQCFLWFLFALYKFSVVFAVVNTTSWI